MDGFPGSKNLIKWDKLILGFSIVEILFVASYILNFYTKLLDKKTGLIIRSTWIEISSMVTTISAYVLKKKKNQTNPKIITYEGLTFKH